jgi:hypothetical protein
MATAAKLTSSKRKLQECIWNKERALWTLKWKYKPNNLAQIYDLDSVIQCCTNCHHLWPKRLPNYWQQIFWNRRQKPKGGKWTFHERAGSTPNEKQS